MVNYDVEEVRRRLKNCKKVILTKHFKFKILERDLEERLIHSLIQNLEKLRLVQDANPSGPDKYKLIFEITSKQILFVIVLFRENDCLLLTVFKRSSNWQVFM